MLPYKSSSHSAKCVRYAPRGATITLSGRAAVAPLSEAMQPFYTTCGASRAPFYKICGVSRHHPPFEPFEPSKPSEPSEPSRPKGRVQRACQKISKTLLTQTPIHGIIIPVAARAAAPRSSSSKTFQKMFDRRYRDVVR